MSTHTAINIHSDEDTYRSTHKKTHAYTSTHIYVCMYAFQNVCNGTYTYITIILLQTLLIYKNLKKV